MIRYASDSYPEVRKRRLRRIGRGAIPELTEAWQAGQLSLRRYDLLSRLSPARQKKALQIDHRKEEAQRLAACTIRSILTQSPERIDLGAIASDIVTTIRSRQALF